MIQEVMVNPEGVVMVILLLEVVMKLFLFLIPTNQFPSVGDNPVIPNGDGTNLCLLLLVLLLILLILKVIIMPQPKYNHYLEIKMKNKIKANEEVNRGRIPGFEYHCLSL